MKNLFWFTHTITQATEVRRQSGSVNNVKDSTNYQLINNNRQNIVAQHQPQAPSSQHAYIYTEIENRPPVNYDVPHPPLQTVYPKSILNNIESRVVNRPKLRQYNAPVPIPSSLPSIVHQPSNTVAAIENVPSNFVSSLNVQQQAYSSSPVITSTYSNRESGNAREKVVVKVVKAPGWYLNDANERNSYFNAVANGLLGENGLVYVNNVQRENAAQSTTSTTSSSSSSSSSQNAPINLIPSNIPVPTYAQTFQKPSTVYNQKNIISPLQSGQPIAYNPIQTYNGINYWPPCFAAAAYSQPIQVSQSQPQPQSQQFAFQK